MKKLFILIIEICVNLTLFFQLFFALNFSFIGFDNYFSTAQIKDINLRIAIRSEGALLMILGTILFIAALILFHLKRKYRHNWII